MKFCPMCAMPQIRNESAVCQFCNYEEKPINELSKTKLCDLMAPYIYQKNEDGVRIKAVKNVRDISLRGGVGIPHFVTEICADAFAHCKFITAIELPQGLRSIGDGAFAHCRDLFDVFIPESVSYIGKGAFSDCYDLSVIRVAATEKPDGWNDEWLLGCSATVKWASTDEN